MTGPMTVRIERKSHSAQQAAKVLRKAMLRTGTLGANAAEAATLTGLPIERCEEALFHLAKAFPARLRVSESGTLHFTFARLRPEAPPRGWRAARAWFLKNEAQIGRTGTYVLGPVFLVAIAYNAFALPNAAMHDLLANAAATSPDALHEMVNWKLAVPAAIALLLGIGANMLGMALLMNKPLIGLPIMTVFPFLFGAAEISLGVTAFFAVVGWGQNWILQINLKRRLGSEAARWPLALARALRGWIYGPATTGPLEDEQRLMAVLLERDRVLSVKDLMLLFGWDKQEAESQLPRMLVDYGGELVVTEEGALVLRFDAQPVDADRFGGRVDTRPAFERQGWPRLWDCPPSLSLFLTVTSAFLVWGLWVHPELSLFPGPGTWQRLLAKDPLLSLVQGLGAWPYMLVLAPTVLRAPAWVGQWVAYVRAWRTRALLRLLARGAEGGPVRWPDGAALLRLGGDVDTDRSEPRAAWVHFPLLAAGDAAAEALRQEVRQVARPEAVVFDTGA